MRSEFYEQRRTSIKDGVALVAFVFGWFAAAPFAWPYIAAGFEDNGNAAYGVLKFLGVVFVVGVASGAFGLALGNASGWAWETLHRRWRGRQSPREEAVAVAAPASPAAAKLPLPPLRFDRGVGVAEYLALAARVGTEAREERGTATALERSITIGAWDGERLVGVARVLSDGYLTAALADLAVDPDYQKRGLGRALLKRAYDATPRGTLNIVAPRGTGSFFDHVGCERALAGFVLRKALKN